MQEPTTGDIIQLSGDLREIDYVELAAYGEPDRSAIMMVCDCVTDSEGSLSVRNEDGRCICLFGYTRDKRRDMAQVWCLTSKDIENYSVSFVKFGRYFIDGLTSQFKEGVYNVVHADNKLSHRWLKACGCLVYPGVPFKADNGEPFTWFTKRLEP